MAAITKSGNAHFDGSVYSGFADGFVAVDIKAAGGYRLGPFVAGEDLNGGDACQINSSGVVVRSVGTSAQGGRVHGFCVSGAANGSSQVYLHSEVIVYYGTSLTPGSPVFLSGTAAGALDTATSTNCPQPIGWVLPDGKRVFLRHSAY